MPLLGDVSKPSFARTITNMSCDCAMIIFEDADLIVLKFSPKGKKHIRDEAEKVMVFLWGRFYVPLILASFASYMTPEVVALPVRF
jgi:hypothetical protein